MKRLIPSLLILLTLSAVGIYYLNQYWIHRYDALIAQHARIYRLDPDLVWSIIYEETYFRPWKVGGAGEVGLMQVTPAVGRAWARETGMRDLANQMARDPQAFMLDPEHNIQIGSWYLEKLYEQYRDVPGTEARMIAAYNAGPSRVAEWNRAADHGRPLTTNEFISRIDIASTRAYVTSVLERYRKLKEARARQGGQVTQNRNMVEAGR
ncbi:MAG TPA: lytic transglycosylase domain-containing protein [Pyrinomonadaceae bacterium]|nr:lytic transglycosylase domain-containing protein [Pyrinomonadaceae bacterium]